MISAGNNQHQHQISSSSSSSSSMSMSMSMSMSTSAMSAKPVYLPIAVPSFMWRKTQDKMSTTTYHIAPASRNRCRGSANCYTGAAAPSFSIVVSVCVCVCVCMQDAELGRVREKGKERKEEEVCLDGEKRETERER